MAMDIWEEIGQLMLEAEKTAEFVGRANKENDRDDKNRSLDTKKAKCGY